MTFTKEQLVIVALFVLFAIVGLGGIVARNIPRPLDPVRVPASPCKCGPEKPATPKSFRVACPFCRNVFTVEPAGTGQVGHLKASLKPALPDAGWGGL
jgi:hypothetical protein